MHRRLCLTTITATSHAPFAAPSTPLLLHPSSLTRCPTLTRVNVCPLHANSHLVAPATNTSTSSSSFFHTSSHPSTAASQTTARNRRRLRTTQFDAEKLALQQQEADDTMNAFIAEWKEKKRKQLELKTRAESSAAAASPHVPAAVRVASPTTSPSHPAPFHFHTLVNDELSFQSFFHAFTHQHHRFISPLHSLIPPNERTIVVAVSGGIDSAMTAALIVESKLYSRVIGLYMRNWDEIEERGECSGERDRKDAERLCTSLNIEYEYVDFSREYYSDVFQNMLDSYASGETPSPDVLCNRVIKFKLLLEYIKKKFGEKTVLATGHYARIKHYEEEAMTAVASSIAPSTSSSASSSSSTPFTPQLYVGLNSRKDQSYFLSSVSSSALSSCIFPLGFFDKTFLKQKAAQWNRERVKIVNEMNSTPVTSVTVTPELKAGFSSAFTSPLPQLSRKKESMGICFIGKRSMQDFLREYIPVHEGEFIDIDTGAVVGQHRGWETLTIGQKAAIGGHPLPYYVCAKRANEIDGITVAKKDQPEVRRALKPNPYAVYVCATNSHPALYANMMFVDEVRWIDDGCKEAMALRSKVASLSKSESTETVPTASGSSSPTTPSITVRIRIRSGVHSTLATLQYDHDSIHRVTFSQPQFAIAAGQTCVIYDPTGTRCLGEGRIQRVGPTHRQQNERMLRGAKILGVQE